jgi:hypothetical protein
MPRKKGKDLKSVLADRAQTSTKLNAHDSSRPPSVLKEGTSPRLSPIEATQPPVHSPTRAETIRRAAEVKRAKQQLLEALSDEQRQKLVAVALKALLNEGREDA